MEERSPCVTHGWHGIGAVASKNARKSIGTGSALRIFVTIVAASLLRCSVVHCGSVTMKAGRNASNSVQIAARATRIKKQSARRGAEEPRSGLHPRIYFFQLSPPDSANSCNGTVKGWCGATTVGEESSERLAIDEMFTDNARHLFFRSYHVKSAFRIVDFVRCRRGTARRRCIRRSPKQKRAFAQPQFPKRYNHDRREPRVHRADRQVRLSR